MEPSRSPAAGPAPRPCAPTNMILAGQRENRFVAGAAITKLKLGPWPGPVAPPPDIMGKGDL